VFAVCALGWLIVSLSIAPAMSGPDVYIFRDAGWNLASSGSFESAALLYMRDLTPRLYSHYTPIMPLLFAGYASVFPRNAYAGTIFNLLLGLLAAGVALGWVLRQPAENGKLRASAALAVAILPVAFITHDRPEAIALVLFSAVIAVATLPRSRPALIGLLIAVVFMAHPFAAIAAGLWIFALYLSHNWNRPERFPLTLRQIAITGAFTAAPLISVALLYYSLDHDSLARFAAHALGMHSGLGVVMAAKSDNSFSHAILHAAAFKESSLETWTYALSLASSLWLCVWAIGNRKGLRHADWLLIAAGLACTFFTVLLFPAQGNYVMFTAFLIPLGLLIVSRTSNKLAVPGMTLLLFVIFIHLPVFCVDLVERIEQRSSYRAARQQPLYLLAQLPSPNALVAVESGSYDVFKPTFQHMIALDNAEDPDHFAKLAAVANCYQTFRGDAGRVRPFPEKLNASEFHMVQADPQHMWVTLLGHKVMRAQWGYGCDLYLRNSPAQPALQR
jgi:hypothetical protein